ERRDGLPRSAALGWAPRAEVEAQRPPPSEGDQDALPAPEPTLELRRDQVGEGPLHRAPHRDRGQLLHEPFLGPHGGDRVGWSDDRASEGRSTRSVSAIRRGGPGRSPAGRRREWGGGPVARR